MLNNYYKGLMLKQSDTSGNFKANIKN